MLKATGGSIMMAIQQQPTILNQPPPILSQPPPIMIPVGPPHQTSQIGLEFSSQMAPVHHITSPGGSGRSSINPIQAVNSVVGPLSQVS